MSQSPGSRHPLQAGTEGTNYVPQAAHHTDQVNGDPMDIASPAAGSMGPPAHSSPNGDSHLSNGHSAEDAQAQSMGTAGSLSAAAAAASQQPKVVQTAFIHKLYT